MPALKFLTQAAEIGVHQPGAIPEIREHAMLPVQTESVKQPSASPEARSSRYYLNADPLVL